MASLTPPDDDRSSPNHRDSVLSIDETFDIGEAKVQMSGMLMKKPFDRKKSSKNKWQRRFFVAKDSFLLYYPETEAKAFQKHQHFNIHPKGILPLGNCKFEECVDGSQKFAIRISHDYFKGEIVVGAENDEEGKKWIHALRECAKVTWRNAQLGEHIIEELEAKSDNVAKEKQEAIDKLNEEASKLELEKGKKEELEKLAAELEKEKLAVEEAAKNLRIQKDTTEHELKSTMSAMEQIEEEKSKLRAKTMYLEANLQTVSKEKDETVAMLAERSKKAQELEEEQSKLLEKTVNLEADLESVSKAKEEAALLLAERDGFTQQLEEEKKRLEEAALNLKGNLTSLEEKSKSLEREKLSTEERLKLEAEMASKLKEEMEQISESATHLRTNLQDMAQKNEETVTALKKEKKRRMNIEKRLRLAEDSMKRLEKALKESGIKIDLNIETDVKNLKQYFELCIAEEQYEAQKLDIMRDAVRSTAQYNIQTKSMESDVSSPPQSPPPVANGSTQNGTTQNGIAANGHSS